MVYDDLLATVVLVTVVFVTVVVALATFSVLLFLIMFTPDRRLIFNDACVRVLRASFYKQTTVSSEGSWKRAYLGVSGGPCSSSFELL